MRWIGTELKGREEEEAARGGVDAQARGGEERRGGRYASERMRMGERGGGGSFEDRAGVPTSMGCYIGKEWWGAACVVAHVQSINEQQEVSFVQVHQGRMASRHAPKIGGW